MTSHLSQTPPDINIHDFWNLWKVQETSRTSFGDPQPSSSTRITTRHLRYVSLIFHKSNFLLKNLGFMSWHLYWQGGTGTAQHAWHANFWHGRAHFGLARFGLAWHGTFWLGAERYPMFGPHPSCMHQKLGKSWQLPSVLKTMLDLLTFG